VQGQNIFIRVNCHSPDAQFVTGAEDPDGDFAAVGNKYGTDFVHTHFSFLATTACGRSAKTYRYSSKIINKMQ